MSNKQRFVMVNTGIYASIVLALFLFGVPGKLAQIGEFLDKSEQLVDTTLPAAQATVGTLKELNAELIEVRENLKPYEAMIDEKQPTIDTAVEAGSERVQEKVVRAADKLAEGFKAKNFVKKYLDEKDEAKVDSIAVKTARITNAGVIVGAEEAKKLPSKATKAAFAKTGERLEKNSIALESAESKLFEIAQKVSGVRGAIGNFHYKEVLPASLFVFITIIFVLMQVHVWLGAKFELKDLRDSRLAHWPIEETHSEE